MTVELPHIGAVSGWSIDTRTLAPGDVFIALRGPSHDGHAYVKTAFAKGAAGAVVEREMAADGPLYVVPDTLAGLQEIAAKARQDWGGTVVGVTGSAGKTTTKDVIAQLLSVAIPTGRTVGNFNNHIGVPLSLLRLPEESRAGVIEMGMNHAGEIRELCAMAKPEIGVITNVGYAHVEFFDSIEGVALAKRELIESLGPHGVAVLNADDERVARFGEIHPGATLTYGTAPQAAIRAEQIELSATGAGFTCEGVRFESPFPGKHGVLNVLAGITVARVFGIPAHRLPDTVRALSAGKMRGERIEAQGMTLLNDAYNANPDAMLAMLDVLAATPARRRIAVLGEMLELGSASSRLHEKVGQYAAHKNIDVVAGIRGHARELVRAAQDAGVEEAIFLEDAECAGEWLRAATREGDAILFKGSRGVQVERALNRLLENDR